MPVLEVNWEIALVRLPKNFYPNTVVFPEGERIASLYEPVFLRKGRVHEVVVSPYIKNQKRLFIPDICLDTRQSGVEVDGWGLYSLEYGTIPFLLSKLMHPLNLDFLDSAVVNPKPLYIHEDLLEKLPGVSRFCEEHGMKTHIEETTGRVFCPICDRTGGNLD